MRRETILACIGVGLLASGAHATDWSAKSSLTQSFEANSNYLLEPNPKGPTYLPVTNLFWSLIGRTPTMRFGTDGDLTYRQYFGPGAETLMPGLDQRYRTFVEKSFNLTTVKFEAARSVQAASTLQLAETGTSTVSGDVTTKRVEGGVKHQLSSRDLVTWLASATSLEFSSPTGTPSRTFSTTGSWIRRLNETNDLTPTVQYETSKYGSASTSQTDVTIWRGTLNLNSRLSNRLNFQGGLGVIHLKVTQSGGGAPPPQAVDLPLTSGSGAAFDWLGNLLLTYRLTNTDRLTLAAARTIGPDSLGTLRKLEIVGLNFTHQVNHRESLTFSGDLSHQVDRSGTTDLYSATASYSYQLARDWYTTVSYRFRQRIGGGTGPAHSNAIFASIRRDITILPDSTQQAAPTRLFPMDWPAAWLRPWRSTAFWQTP